MSITNIDAVSQSGTSIMKGALDIQKQFGDQVAKMIDASDEAPKAANENANGSTINITA